MSSPIMFPGALYWQIETENSYCFANFIDMKPIEMDIRMLKRIKPHTMLYEILSENAIDIYDSVKCENVKFSIETFFETEFGTVRLRTWPF